MPVEKPSRQFNRTKSEYRRPTRVRPTSLTIAGREALKSTSIAEKLGISLQALHRYLRDPRIDPDTGETFVLPAIAIGRAIFIYEDDLAAYVTKLNRCRLARLSGKEGF